MGSLGLLKGFEGVSRDLSVVSTSFRESKVVSRDLTRGSLHKVSEDPEGLMGCQGSGVFQGGFRYVLRNSSIYHEISGALQAGPREFQEIP